MTILTSQGDIPAVPVDKDAPVCGGGGRQGQHDGAEGGQLVVQLPGLE